MSRLGLLLAAFLALSTGAAAQERSVRSGNHPNFARFTLPLGAQETWTATRTDDGVVIAITDHTGGYDVSDVFTRVPKDRVNQIDAGRDMLTFVLACNCGATAFRSGALLVIDVVDPGFPLKGPSIRRGAPAPPPLARSAPWQPGGSVLPWLGRRPPQTGDGYRTGQLSAGQEAGDTSSDEDAVVQQMQETLAAEFAAAASMGLLNSSYEAPYTIKSLPRDTAQANPVERAPLPDALAVPKNNMRITSSIDKPFGPHTNGTFATSTGVACPADGFASVGEWGDESGFAVQIGPARNALVDVRDRIDPAAVVNLAKLYMYFGFGAEALDVLLLEPSLIEKHAHLGAIATILERGAISGANPLEPYTDCGSDVALWASLSFEDIPGKAIIDVKATLRALNKLPRHLRQIVAPELSERLLQYEEPQAAAAALRSVERLPDQMTPDGIMVQAALAIKTGTPADDKLEKVIDGNTEESPAALIALVETKVARDKPISYETTTLVEAYAQELRGTDMGNRLLQTQIIALSQAAQFDEAFDALGILAPAISTQQSRNLHRTVVEQLTKNANDMVFLDHFFRQDTEVVASLGTSLKLAVAERLMDLGFVTEVQGLLDTVPDRPLHRARQLTSARAAIALRQPYRAQAALVGLDDPEASRLLAQAKEMAGSYAEAAQIFTDLDAPERAAEAAWLSEDWPGPIRPGSPAFGAIAARVGADIGDLSPAEGPLGRADSALKESRALREALKDLLTAPALQITEDPDAISDVGDGI
ncbi:hypothetical protein [uncultured Sulfitobacter sp.]|uniref:hypothetical protein n=1 Tax=uncultured Sulfitobacter sp. TaxID=191468 RepID=UPI00261321CC|nr:hypothetical protein [uncultured Sulfitobacter sp.]